MSCVRRYLDGPPLTAEITEPVSGCFAMGGQPMAESLTVRSLEAVLGNQISVSSQVHASV
jgi:hypothetical protein